MHIYNRSVHIIMSGWKNYDLEMKHNSDVVDVDKQNIKNGNDQIATAS